MAVLRALPPTRRTKKRCNSNHSTRAPFIGWMQCIRQATCRSGGEGILFPGSPVMVTRPVLHAPRLCIQYSNPGGPYAPHQCAVNIAALPRASQVAAQCRARPPRRFLGAHLRKRLGCTCLDMELITPVFQLDLASPRRLQHPLAPPEPLPLVRHGDPGHLHWRQHPSGADQPLWGLHLLHIP